MASATVGIGDVCLRREAQSQGVRPAEPSGSTQPKVDGLNALPQPAARDPKGKPIARIAGPLCRHRDCQNGLKSPALCNRQWMQRQSIDAFRRALLIPVESGVRREQSAPGGQWFEGESFWD